MFTKEKLCHYFCEFAVLVSLYCIFWLSFLAPSSLLIQPGQETNRRLTEHLNAYIYIYLLQKPGTVAAPRRNCSCYFPWKYVQDAPVCGDDTVQWVLLLRLRRTTYNTVLQPAIQLQTNQQKIALQRNSEDIKHLQGIQSRAKLYSATVCKSWWNGTKI